MNFLNRKKPLTLVLGGTGKTGRRVAERLKAIGRDVRIGHSRPAAITIRSQAWASSSPRSPKTTTMARSMK